MSDDMTTMTISLPKDWKKAITERAKEAHKTTSQWMRDLLEKELDNKPEGK